uniref:Phorbol-ester/DAG-type domain-containing protein n=1 Tax=Panagrolaimus superbus TaxID=310955 RepID=A0A914Y104_9BILA
MKLVEDNILVKLQNHNSFIFTTKSVMELEPRLRADNYDIPQCPVCSLLIIVQRFSYFCESCETAIHNTCLYKMINLSKNTAVSCPGGNRCSNKYDNDTLEDLEFDADLPETVNRPVEIRGNARTQQDDNTENEEPDDEDIDDEDMEVNE